MELRANASSLKGHGAHQNPEAIAEVLRILKANAR
jgi:hypothetical protein